jgi:hypothetical protein
VEQELPVAVKTMMIRVVLEVMVALIVVTIKADAREEEEVAAVVVVVAASSTIFSVCFLCCL